MAQIPFTPEGVQQWQQGLYPSPDSVLQAQAERIRMDFRQWVKDTFLLDPEQQIYLNRMDDAFLTSLGYDVQYAVVNRLEILLGYPEKPQVASKLVKIQNMINPNTTPVSGWLKVIIEYV